METEAKSQCDREGGNIFITDNMTEAAHVIKLLNIGKVFVKKIIILSQLFVTRERMRVLANYHNQTNSIYMYTM